MVSGWEQELRSREERRRAEAATVPVLRMRHHATLPPVQWRDRVVTASVGPAGEAVTLWATDTGAARVTVDGTGGRTQVIDIEALAFSPSTVQPLPDGRVLVVAARCAWGEHNAAVLDGDGRIELLASVGDGVAHVQATAEGAVWVGYTDEGVLGTRLPTTAAPVGAPGLVRFASDLRPAWHYDGRDWGRIDDCYALNVVGDTAWTCFYSRFPLVRIQEDATLGWHNTVATGVSAILVDERWVALFGGYGTHRHRLVIATLEGGVVNPLRELRLTLPDGSPLPSGQLVGRGAELHLLTGRDWYRFSLADLGT